jgi:hypothetical protein
MRACSWLGPLVLGCSCAPWLGCGGGAAAAPPAQSAPVETAAPASAPAGPPNASAAPATPPSDDADTAPAAKPQAAKSEKSEDPNATRDITYVVVPEGLKISVAGVKFTVSASAAQVGPGFGAKVSVVASAEDGKPHSLSSPKAGPMAFAGSVTRKGKTDAEAFGDERAGDGEQSIFGDDPTKFSRTWPGKGVRPLAIGDALDLQIALWGLGTNTDARRPVKQFCHVRLEVPAKGKPKAIVEPPKSASGK